MTDSDGKRVTTLAIGAITIVVGVFFIWTAYDAWHGDPPFVREAVLFFAWGIGLFALALLKRCSLQLDALVPSVAYVLAMIVAKLYRART